MVISSIDAGANVYDDGRALLVALMLLLNLPLNNGLCAGGLVVVDAIVDSRRAAFLGEVGM